MAEEQQKQPSGKTIAAIASVPFILSLIHI